MSTGYRVAFSGEPAVGELEFVSELCGALIGSTPEEIAARPALWIEAIHPDDRDTFVQTTAQLIANGEAVTRHYRLRHAISGEYHMIEDRLTAMFNAEGQIVGYEATLSKPS